MNSLIRTFTAAALFCVAAAASQAADDVATGTAALRTGDFTGATALWQDMATVGNPSAVNNLAFMYISGNGVTRDVAKGMDLLKAAADFGYPMSQYNLGLMYANAEKFGLAPVGAAVTATDLYRAAAFGGHVRAQYLLATRTFLGVGTEKDPLLAYTWLKVARTGTGTDLNLAKQIDALIEVLEPLLAAESLRASNIAAGEFRIAIQANSKSAAASGQRVADVLPAMVAQAQPPAQAPAQPTTR